MQLACEPIEKAEVKAIKRTLGTGIECAGGFQDVATLSWKWIHGGEVLAGELNEECQRLSSVVVPPNHPTQAVAISLILRTEDRQHHFGLITPLS
jgi:hypothetical protein